MESTLPGSPPVAGADVVYSIIVSNEGPDAAQDVQLMMSVPPETSFSSIAAPAGWSCNATPPIVCTIASFPVGSAAFSLTVALPASTPRDTILTETSSVTTTTNVPDPDKLTATVTASVVWQSVLSIAKSAPASEIAGNTLTYTVTITNLGPSHAGDLVFNDVLPAPLTFQSITATGWTCATPAVGANGAVQCTRAEAPLGAGTITIVTQIPSSATGQVTNAADVTASTDSGTRTADTTTQFTTSANLSLLKTSAPAAPVSARPSNTRSRSPTQDRAMPRMSS